MASDRPGGMDSLKMNHPTPTQKSKPMASSIDKVAKAAGGAVDSGQRSRGVKMPSVPKKGKGSD